MHRGHNWTLRAETHDTMMAWYNDIKELTEKKGEARNEYVRRQHARSVSGHSLKAGSIGAASSNDGIEDDEADKVPYSSEQSVRGPSVAEGAGAGVAGRALGIGATRQMEDNRSEAGWRPPQRPSPGGRFPSDVNVARGLQAPHSPSSGEVSDVREADHDTMMAAANLPGSGVPFSKSTERRPELPSETEMQPTSGARTSAYSTQQNTPTKSKQSSYVPDYHYGDFRQGNTPIPPITPQHDEASNYGDWMAPIAAGTGAGVGGAALGAAGAQHQQLVEDERHIAEQTQLDREQPQPKMEQRRFEDETLVADATSVASKQQMGHDGMIQSHEDAVPVARDPKRPIESIDNVKRQMDDSAAVPAHGTSSAPIFIETNTSQDVVETQERSLSRPRGITESTQATGYTTTTNPSTSMSGIDARYGGASSSVAGSGRSLSTVPTSVDINSRDPAPPTKMGTTDFGSSHQNPTSPDDGALTAAGFRAGPMSQDELMYQQSPKDATGKPLLSGLPGDSPQVGLVKPATNDMHMPGEFPSVYNAVTN